MLSVRPIDCKRECFLMIPYRSGPVSRTGLDRNKAEPTTA